MATLAYFAVPKILNTDEKYKKLSVEARYLYAHMRDTLKLSIKNNWQDKYGFFIKMKRTTIAGLLNKCVPTARKVVRELIAAGLIFERCVGLTQPNRFYIQYLPGESETDFLPKEKEKAPSVKKPDFTPDGNAFSPNNHNPNERNPNNPNKKHWKWFIKEGDRWFDQKGDLWQFIDGEVHPYIYGEALKRNTAELLRQIGMTPEDIIACGC